MEDKVRTRNPGKNINLPSQICTDKNCPFHGSLKVRGNSFTGTVVSDKMRRSVTVMWEGQKFIPKYERFKKTRTKIIAHNPLCVNAKEGDMVKIMECRPISKLKHFVVVESLGKEKAYSLKKRLEEEGKHKLKKKEIANIESEKVETEEK